MRKGWSIDRVDWEALEQVLPQSGNWNSVLLTKNDQSAVPERPGVYAICAKPPNATGNDHRTVFHSLASPLYIGKSKSNINSRFLKHCRPNNPELLRAKACFHRVKLRFWFIILPVSAVESAEAQLIECFGPPVNQRRGTITGTIRAPIEA